MKTPGESRFNPQWLALRSTYDERARSQALLPLFVDALRESANGLSFTDLACGTASNFLYLAPRIGRRRPLNQIWRLVDHDPLVLDRASERITEHAGANGWRIEAAGEDLVIDAQGTRWTVQFQRLDLARDLESLLLHEGEAVVFSALLDLVSPAWLQRFVDWIRPRTAPVLGTLTYDGTLDWKPAHRDDDHIRALFNDHQRRNKGFGPALGPSAPSWIATRLLAAGYTVETAPSPWRLEPDDRAIFNALIEGISTSAAEQDPQARRLVEGWSASRGRQANAGLLSATVGHIDVLALP